MKTSREGPWRSFRSRHRRRPAGRSLVDSSGDRSGRRGETVRDTRQPNPPTATLVVVLPSRENPPTGRSPVRRAIDSRRSPPSRSRTRSPARGSPLRARVYGCAGSRRVRSDSSTRSDEPALGGPTSPTTSPPYRTRTPPARLSRRARRSGPHPKVPYPVLTPWSLVSVRHSRVPATLSYRSHGARRRR